MTKFQPPKIPFVEANLIGPKQKPTAIVLNLSMTTSEKGAALGIANRLHKQDSPSVSYHYIIDEATIYQGVWNTSASFFSPYRSLSILICAQPHEDVPMWNGRSAAPVLAKTAELIADLSLAYKIPVRYLGVDAEVKWKARRSRRRGGIISLIPGDWPLDLFLQEVHTIKQTKMNLGR